MNQMTRSITFPKTSADTWTNRETGMEIHRDSGVYTVSAPSKFRNGFPVSGDMTTLSEARTFAKTYVSAVVRPLIARAFDDATAEDADRPAVIHHVTRYGVISCGVTGWVRVEEVAMKVTCEACIAADHQHLIDKAHGEALHENAERDASRQNLTWFKHHDVVSGHRVYLEEAISVDHSEALMMDVEYDEKMVRRYWACRNAAVDFDVILPPAIRYAGIRNTGFAYCSYRDAITWLEAEYQMVIDEAHEEALVEACRTDLGCRRSRTC